MEELLMRKRLLLLAFMAMALLLCQRLYAQKPIVIVHPSVTVTEVSASDLRDIFTGVTTTLHGGAHVAPVLLKQGPTHEEMLTLYIGKSDSAFRATWRSLVFSGQGIMPRSLDSEAAIVDFVAHTPGAIGYIGKATPHEGVRTLAVR